MNIYETEILSIMPFLQVKGLKYIGCKSVIKDDKARIYAMFEDPRGLGQELAMIWNSSPEKQYRDYWTYFRNEIDRAIRGTK